MLKRNALVDRLYRRGAIWWVWGYDLSDVRWRESTKQTERKAALEAAKAIELRRTVPADRTAQAAQEYALGEALSELMAEDARANAAAKTVEFHRDRSRHLLRVYGRDRRTADLSITTSNEYMDKRLAEGASRHTIQKEFRVLIQALRLAAEHGLYRGNPSDLMPRSLRKQAGFYKPRTTWLETVEYCQALIDHAPEHRRLHVAAYIQLGVRSSELYVIYPEHVQLEQRRVWVAGIKTPGSARWVWLSPTAVEIIKRKLHGKSQGRPLFEPWGDVDSRLKSAWRRARKSLIAAAKNRGEDLEAALPLSISCNDLRRTFCSLMASAGVPMQHCAKLMGHKSLDMVMEVYGRLTPESLESAVDALPALALTGTVTAAVSAEVPKSNAHALVERSLGTKSA